MRRSLEGWLATGSGGTRAFAGGERLEQDLSAALQQLGASIARAAEKLEAVEVAVPDLDDLIASGAVELIGGDYFAGFNLILATLSTHDCIHIAIAPIFASL